MSVDLSAIGENTVKSIPDGNVVQLKSFWQQQPALVVFFRRWGCLLCRLWAKELSEIAPVLTRNNVRVIGVGVEEEGSKEFLDGKFFDGELYYVDNVSTYHALGYKRFNYVTILTSLLWKQSRDAIAKGREMGVGNNLKGDWVQVGGALLVDRDGKVLKHFVQAGPGDHYPNADILKDFGLESEYKVADMPKDTREGVECAKKPNYPNFWDKNWWETAQDRQDWKKGREAFAQQWDIKGS